MFYLQGEKTNDQFQLNDFINNQRGGALYND